MLKSRKKILLSSIAMLLVAMIALGSATFAWFSMNKNVTSDDMNIKSSAAQGLQITNNRGATWSNEANFNAYTQQTFTPVSVGYTSAQNAYQAFGTPYYVEENTKTGKASQTGGIAGTWNSTTVPDLSAVADDGENKNFASVRNSYFAVYEIGVKSSGSAIDNVSFTLSFQDAGDYARVAIFDNGVASPSGAFTLGAPIKVYGMESNPQAVTTVTSGAWTSDTDQKLETTTEGAGYSNTVATLTAPANDEDATSAGHYYTIVVWFEGEDSNCTDAAQSKDLELAAKFNY